MALTDGAFELNVRNFDLSHAMDKHVNAEYLRGLINVVPLRGAGDRAGRYCIGRFAIDMYGKLLNQRQQMHPTYCHPSVFLPAQDQVLGGWDGSYMFCSVERSPSWQRRMRCAQVRLNRADVISAGIWDAFTEVDMSQVRKVRNVNSITLLWWMCWHLR